VRALTVLSAPLLPQLVGFVPALDSCRTLLCRACVLDTHTPMGCVLLVCFVCPPFPTPLPTPHISHAPDQPLSRPDTCTRQLLASCALPCAPLCVCGLETVGAWVRLTHPSPRPPSLHPVYPLRSIWWCGRVSCRMATSPPAPTKAVFFLSVCSAGGIRVEENHVHTGIRTAHKNRTEKRETLGGRGVGGHAK
jgi:hypothetical protein